MHLVGTAAFKAVETSDPRLAGSIPVHLRQSPTGRFGRDVESALSCCELADVCERSPNVALEVTLRERAFGSEHGGLAMPRAPRGKRVLDAVSGSYTVVGRAPTGEPEPDSDGSRGVWVAPRRKPDGKVGRPTGKTRAAAVASRNRHIAAAEEAVRCGPLAEGFSAATTLAELGAWWFENVARHRVRPTTLSTYRKQWRLIAADVGSTPVRQLRTEQVAAFVSRMVDRGAASRAANIRTLLVQVLDETVSLGLAETNVAKKVRRRKVPKVTRPTLTPVEVVKLLDACDERFVAVVAFRYLHGWRVGGPRRSTRASSSISCSRRRRASRCCARTSIERSAPPLGGRASIRPSSPRTPAGARW